MRGGRAGPLLGRELYAENADRDLGVGSPPVPTRPVYFPGKLKQTSNPSVLQDG